MPLLPVTSTRTSTPLSTQRLLFQLNADQLAIQKQYDQLSTGRRVLRLSDDPAAAGRAIGLYRGIDRATQLSRNANSVSNFYQAADSALANVDNALIEARAVAVAGAQNVISDDERVALAETLQEAINNIFSSGNSIFRDHKTLGGFLGDSNSFTYDGKEVVFTGNEAVAQARLGAGQLIPVNVGPGQALGAGSVVLEGDPLNAALSSGSRLVDLRRGQGVQAGVIKISGGGNFTEVNLQSAATIGDVVDLISQVKLEGRPITASLTSDGIRIEYADGLAGTLAIDDAIGSTSATDLGILNPQGLTAPPIISDGLSPRVTKTTQLSDFNNGSGFSLSDGIQIEQGSKIFTVDFTGAETIGDVLIKINRSGADVKAELDEAAGRIRIRSLRSGVNYSIGENGGNDARELGIRSATELTRISDLNKGRGLRYNLNNPDLTISRPDGTQLDFELEDVETIQEVIELIRNHPDNQDSRRVLVQLNDIGNGLQLKAPPGTNRLSVRQNGTSDAGVQLGLIPPGQSESEGSIVGSVDTIIGRDYSPRDAGGVFDTLIRLQEAVRSGDLPEIGRLQEKLDIDIDRAVRTRGRMGVFSRNVDQLQEAAEVGKITLQAQLSDEIDADLATVISELSQRQVALEASMRIIGQTANMTVLNFL